MQAVPTEPVFLNVETIFAWLYLHVGGFFKTIFSIEFFRTLQGVAGILVVLLITVILYCLVRLYEFKQEDAKKSVTPSTSSSPVKPATAGVAIADLPIAKQNPTWEAIRTKLLSEHPSDWRLGIIEADIYLDRVLDSKNYVGDTLGDKLKNLTSGELPSLQIAWEAHKVRNRIAHDGADFALTMPEARRVLSYFEIVFRDLGVIE